MHVVVLVACLFPKMIFVNCTETLQHTLVIVCTIPTIFLRKEFFLDITYITCIIKISSWICMFRFNCIVKRDFLDIMLCGEYQRSVGLEIELYPCRLASLSMFQFLVVLEVKFISGFSVSTKKKQT